jgi:hypothetical protein
VGISSRIVFGRKSPGRAITEAEALDRLSDGFEWAYDHPIVSFLVPDGTLVLLERRLGAGGSWYHCDPDETPGTPLGEAARELLRARARHAEIRARVSRRFSRRPLHVR